MNNKVLCEKLYDVAIKELSDFEKSLDTVEKALGAAYELSVKRDIMSYIENEINEITSDNMEKAITEMINSGSPLSLIYDEWLGNEYDNRMEAIRMTADDVIDITAEKINSIQRNFAAGLEQGSYSFTVISFDGNENIAVDEYIEKDDPAIYDLDLLKDYAAALDKDIKEVEVEASFYIIGNGGTEAYSPDEKQLAYINNHLDKVLSEASLLESNTFTVDISDIARAEEEKIFTFTVAEFEDGSKYVLPGVIDDNNIKETSAWEEVKERCFNIDECEDLCENIRVTYAVYNAETEGNTIPSEEELKKISNNLDSFVSISELTSKNDGSVFPWQEADEIIYDMKKYWEEAHKSNPSVSDDFDKSNFLFPKELKVVARCEDKKYYNLDESIEQIKLSGKEWLDPFDTAVEMNRRGVNIHDIEMLSVRYVSEDGHCGRKDMTPEMYAVYNMRTEAHANEFEEAKNTFEAKCTEVYKKSFAEAKETGEIDIYHRSNKVNQRCAHVIDTVNASHYENNHFHAKDALAAVMEYGYSLERVALVVAINLSDKSWDARVSGENISWAKEYLSDVADDITNRKGNCYLTTHPGLLDMYAIAVRDEIACYKEMRTENVSYSDKLSEVEEVADKIQDAINNGELDKGKDEQSKGWER